MIEVVAVEDLGVEVEEVVVVAETNRECTKLVICRECQVEERILLNCIVYRLLNTSDVNTRLSILGDHRSYFIYRFHLVSFL